MKVQLSSSPGPARAAWPAGDPIRRRWRISSGGALAAEALLIQHSGDTPGNPLLAVLRDHSFKAVTIRSDLGAELPDPASARLAVVLGLDEAGDTLEPERLEAELEWIRRADRARTMILGIGFGAQLLARALGGGAEPARNPLRGWTMVSTEIPHVIARGPWLSWQENVIQVPPRGPGPGAQPARDAGVSRRAPPGCPVPS